MRKIYNKNKNKKDDAQWIVKSLHKYKCYSFYSISLNIMNLMHRLRQNIHNDDHFVCACVCVNVHKTQEDTIELDRERKEIWRKTKHSFPLIRFIGINMNSRKTISGGAALVVYFVLVVHSVFMCRLFLFLFLVFVPVSVRFVLHSMHR